MSASVSVAHFRMFAYDTVGQEQGGYVLQHAASHARPTRPTTLANGKTHCETGATFLFPRKGGDSFKHCFCLTLLRDFGDLHKLTYSHDINDGSIKLNLCKNINCPSVFLFDLYFITSHC